MRFSRADDRRRYADFSISPVLQPWSRKQGLEAAQARRLKLNSCGKRAAVGELIFQAGFESSV